MIRILHDTGGAFDPDDYEVVAEYDPEAAEWVRDDEEFERYYPSGTPPEAILRQLDGPTYIAVEAGEGETEKSPTGGPHAATLADWETVDVDEEDDDES